MKMMLKTITIAAALFSVAASAQNAQQPSIQCDKAHAADCAPAPQNTGRPPSTVDKFPFPGEAAPAQQPAQPASGTQPGGTADKFPFPGGDLDKTPIAPEDAPQPQAPSSSSSAPTQPDFSTPPSSDGMGSSSSSSSEDEPAPTTQSDDAPVRAAPLPNYGTKRSRVEEQTRKRNEEHRVEDDLKVAKFYLNDGNVNGAYLRYKDAIEHDPEESDAHLGMAEMAEKLNKLDEAREHYAEFLKLDPENKRAAEVQHTLDRLNAKAGKK